MITMQLTPTDGYMHTKDITELQAQYNVNLSDCDEWFDIEELPAHVTIIDELEFYYRYHEE